jgi:Rad3-related DNA helicase
MTYKLPHLLDRPGQQDALNWMLNSDKKYLILCAPTGFGKSSLAAACSIDCRTLVLVLHKSLQDANYKQQYAFDILYGKSNYPCVEKNEKAQKQTSFLPRQYFTAFDCGNPECECPYQEQEQHCLQSQRVSLNYAKALMSRKFSEQFEADFLFLDEAHNLPEITMSHVGLTIDWDNEFLQSNGRIQPTFEGRLNYDEAMVQSNGRIQPTFEGRLNYDEAMVLFRQCARAIERTKPSQREDLKRWRKWKRLHQKIHVTNDILITGSLKDWYYETTNKSLIIKPLTAKYHFKRLFDVANKVVMMSATIRPSIAERLGLEPDEFDYYEVPNPWPVPTRLIYDLGGPAINWKSGEADKQKQAELIANVLQPNKSGIIHVTSKAQAYELADRLSDLNNDYYDFYYPENGIGTDRQLQCWYDERQPGVYCISWCFHEGVDLGDDSIIVLAKTPYASIGSNYERAKMEYDQQWYLEKTAYTFQQAAGRNRRGKPEHYTNGARQVFIADSSWHRLKTLLSDDFIKSVRNWNGK